MLNKKWIFQGGDYVKQKRKFDNIDIKIFEKELLMIQKHNLVYGILCTTFGLWGLIFAAIVIFDDWGDLTTLSLSLIPILFGLLFLYIGLFNVFNKTIVRVNEKTLFYSKGPLFPRRHKNVPITSIVCLETRLASGGKQTNKSVNILTQDGQRLSLFSLSATQAENLRGCIEDFLEMLHNRTGFEYAIPLAKPMPSAPPKRVRIENSGGDLHIQVSQKRLGWQELFIFAFLSIFPAIGIFLLLPILELDLSLKIVGIIFILLGVSLLYSAISSAFKPTTMNINHQQIVVNPGPYPPYKPHTINMINAIQFFCKEEAEISQHRREDDSIHTHVQYVYSLYAEKSNDQIVLINTFTDKEIALVLERELDNYFGFSDEEKEEEAGLQYTEV